MSRYYAVQHRERKAGAVWIDTALVGAFATREGATEAVAALVKVSRGIPMDYRVVALAPRVAQ